MQKIKMLTSTPGALNKGLDVHTFKAGLVYPNAEIEDMEGLDEIFLEIGVAELYETPSEVIRHQRGISGATINKRVEVPENKDVLVVDDEEVEEVEKPKSKRNVRKKK